MPPERAEAEALAGLLERCRLRLGAHFAVAYGAGRALDLDAALREALVALGEPPPPQAPPAEAGGDALSIQMLGPLRIRHGGAHLDVREMLGDDAADLLALLAVHPGAPVTRDAALAALWPGRADDPERLSRTISVLRAALDPDRRHDPSWFLATGAGSWTALRPTRTPTRRRVPRRPGPCPPPPRRPSSHAHMPGPCSAEPRPATNSKNSSMTG